MIMFELTMLSMQDFNEEKLYINAVRGKQLPTQPTQENSCLKKKRL